MSPLPTIVLVHGAWADASSWNPVITALRERDFTVLTVPNLLRGVAGDAAYVASAIAQRTSGPVVLAGHSYGGAVISGAALGGGDVRALVYVDAFLPDDGETVVGLLGGTGSALDVPDPTTVLDVVGYPGAPEGDADAYLKASTVHESFAQDLDPDVRELVFATQRPIALAANVGPAGPPAWRQLPSWTLVGTEDRIIPPAAQRRMAERAGSTIVETPAGHVSMLAAPDVVTGVIVAAAESLG
ncbi:alpha/beta hydrolase [Leifsonia naganoensis]|uniref:Pimeloyl-ACP methyl ester carboxylesterase n=1 Tax=Leifsonia naganoensis TaxID=150025 RepID=A0A853DLJ2_9MICO|nr:pimeloyl-ACP methyl ester carboxylesterase [Leifsonia naganoensis]